MAVAHWTRPDFRGDPLPLATAAPAGSLAQSWTGSKNGPVLVDYSASGITCAGVDYPYLRGEFKATLQAETSPGSGVYADESRSSRGLTNPVTETAAEAVVGVYGPEGSVVCEPATSTSYRWKVVARFRNDTDDGYETGTFYTTAVTVTVVSGANKRYAKSTGNDANNGTTVELAKAQPFLVDNLQYNVIDDLTLTTNLDAGEIDGAQIIGNDAGARIALSRNNILLFSAFPDSSTELVFKHLTFTTTSATQMPIILSLSDSSGILFYDCGTSGVRGVVVAQSKPTRLGFWGCDFDASVTEEGSTLFTDDSGWLAVYGCDFASNVETGLDHCYYPSGIGNHKIIRWMSCSSFATTGSGSFFINFNTTATAGTYGEYIFLADCDVARAHNGLDASNSNNQWSVQGGFRNMLVEGMVFHNLTGRGIAYFNADMTVRDCIFFDIPSGSHIVLQDDDVGVTDNLSVIRSIRNKFYKGAADVVTTRCIEIENNIAGGHEIRDCDFQDMRTQPIILRVNFTLLDEMVAAGLAVSGNRIYAPNDTSGGKFISDSSTGQFKTIAEFEAATGLTGTFTVEDPDWHDPANGDFRTEAEYLAQTSVARVLTIRTSAGDYSFAYTASGG